MQSKGSQLSLAGFNVRGMGFSIAKIAASSFLAGAVSFAATTATASETWGDRVADSLSKGDISLGFRYRYELVDDSAFARDANASTLRTRLVYESADFENFALTLGMDDLRPVVGRNFNDTRNGKSQYPVVADPQGTDLNLASVAWTGIENLDVVLGRQRIMRGNVRFIGNVGWRQNEQTYDALSLSYDVADNVKANYSYIDSVRRIFGPDSGTPTDSLDSKSHLLDAQYTLNEFATFFGYAYLLDFDNAPTASSRTLGFRVTGAYTIRNGPRLGYAAEFATQADYKNNPSSYDAGYYLIETAADWDRFGFKLGYEVLESDGSSGQSFQTPLATGHKFNGWADRFLGTPPGGLKDLYIEANAKLFRGDWRLIYHDYSADSGPNGDYGDEIDFVASWKLGKHYAVLAKFALYEAKTWSTDVDKFWVMLTADF